MPGFGKVGLCLLLLLHTYDLNQILSRLPSVVVPAQVSRLSELPPVS